MKPVYAPIVLAVLALLLGMGAWKLDIDAGSVRDALPNGGAATELPVATPATDLENRLLADQMQLGSDLRMVGVGTQAESVRDTEKLIRDVSVSSVSRTSRADELGQAVGVVRLHTCTECLRLLHAAAEVARP